MVTIKPAGGLCNRLRFLISSIHKHGQVRVVWRLNTTDVSGMWVPMKTLFDNELEEINTDESGIVGNNFEDIHKESYLKIINKYLQPVEPIRHQIADNERLITPDTACFSIRTYTLFENEYREWGHKFKIERLWPLMEKEPDIFVNCDNAEVLDEIKKRFDVKTICRRSAVGEWRTLDSMYDAVTELFIGGRCRTIYATKRSSFPQMQWWFGRCRAQYREVELHG